MKYPIQKEFGLYAHFHPPVYQALLPLMNGVLSVLPKQKQTGIAVRNLQIPSDAGGTAPALLFTPEGIGGNLQRAFD